MAQFEDHSEFGHSLLHDRQARSFGQICGRFTPKVPSGPRPLRIHKRGDDGESYLVNQCHVKREGGWLGKGRGGGSWGGCGRPRAEHCPTPCPGILDCLRHQLWVRRVGGWTQIPRCSRWRVSCGYDDVPRLETHQGAMLGTVDAGRGVMRSGFDCFQPYLWRKEIWEDVSYMAGMARSFCMFYVRQTI